MQTDRRVCCTGRTADAPRCAPKTLRGDNTQFPAATHKILCCTRADGRITIMSGVRNCAQPSLIIHEATHTTSLLRTHASHVGAGCCAAPNTIRKRNSRATAQTPILLFRSTSTEHYITANYCCTIYCGACAREFVNMSTHSIVA